MTNAAPGAVFVETMRQGARGGFQLAFAIQAGSLVGDALWALIGLAGMALQQRKPEDVIHHSDQGSQYTSVAFGERCKKMGVRPSMGTVGDAYDNAMAESFFAGLECELIDRKTWQAKTGARWRCSPTSRLGPTHDAGTARWATSHRPTTKANTAMRQS